VFGGFQYTHRSVAEFLQKETRGFMGQELEGFDAADMVSQLCPAETRYCYHINYDATALHMRRQYGMDQPPYTYLSYLEQWEKPTKGVDDKVGSLDAVYGQFNILPRGLT
jgi:hypothetical protein